MLNLNLLMNMKKVILSCASLMLAMSGVMAQTSEYTPNYDGYLYTANWADCMGEKSVSGGTAGKLDQISFSTAGEVIITTVGAQGGYIRSASYLPLVDKSQISYEPTDCSDVLPGLDLTELPAEKRKLKVEIKASSNVNVRLLIGQGASGSDLCANNFTSTIGVNVTTDWQELEIDLSNLGNLLTNGSCADGDGNLPLDKLSFVGFNPDFEEGNFAGTLHIRKIAIGEELIVASVSNPQVNNSLINVYPNPAVEHIRVDLAALNSTNSTVKVMNANGMVVYEAQTSGDSELINISSFKKGMYMVQVSAGNKISNQKFIVQ
jgi:hypothetical protein